MSRERPVTLAVLAGLALAGLVLAALPAAEAAFPGRNGRIAFTREIGTNAEVFTMNADGSGQLRLTDSAGDERRPSFSPGGTRLAFARIVPPGNWEIFTTNLDGRQEVNRTNDVAGHDYTPVFSPDGRKIVYALYQTGEQCSIWVMNADGSDQAALTDNRQCDRDPAWQPLPG